MKRIMIIGPGNAGKSTLAKQLGHKLNIPIYHLDQYYWLPDWEARPEEDWKNNLNELVSGESWIIEGDFAESYGIRANRADTIIFLDLPVSILILRFLRRVFENRGKTRSDMAPGNIERVNMGYINWLLKYDRSRPQKLIHTLSETHQTYVLKSLKEISQFLGKVNSSKLIG